MPTSPRTILLLFAALTLVGPASAQPDSTGGAPDDPLRLAVAGMVHGHVHGFLRARPYEGVRVVGVAEADTALLARRAEEYDIEPARRYRDLGTMLEATRPDAVVTFTHTFDHRRVVETAARHGVDVMVEKPLAVSMEHARAIRDAAETHDIHVLTNYETTWYPSTQRVYELARTEQRFGPLRKVVVRDGHRGPKEIGVGPAFLQWLTDPTLNGGGALMDFGCYGANLMTRLMEGRRPLSVTAVTQQLKSDPVYRRVDDVATILLTYPGAQGIIQASWNWPFSRKDMSVYGQNGYVHADDATHLRLRVRGTGERAVTLASEPPFYESAVPYLRRVVRGKIEPNGLSSLSNNMIVTEILDAARRSARTGETVRLRDE
ncbi:MAG: Gfo/Idh/MocA family protein [Salinibacter sp.]